MISVKELKSAVKRLKKDELFAFRRWFEKFDAKVWDREFEEDAISGKLDKIAEKAIADYKSGRCKEI
jgi:hypothetical protein